MSDSNLRDRMKFHSLAGNPMVLAMKGHTWSKLRNGKTGEIVDGHESKNTILLNIRKPITKLLGCFGNVNLAYNLNGGGWNTVPDTYQLNGINGDLQLQVVPSTLPFIARIAFGSDGTAATEADLDLYAEIAGSDKFLAANPTFSSDGLRATYTVLFDVNEMNNVEMREAALRTVDGTTVARSPIGYHKKIPGFYWEFYWEIGWEA